MSNPPAGNTSDERVVGGLDTGLGAAVVMATYNEAENLPVLLEKLLALQEPVGVVIVDDNSPDGTGEIAAKWAEEQAGRVVAIHRPGKLGYASAMQRGFACARDAGVPVVISMDADHSHDPAVVPEMLGAIGQADMVIGSRYVAGGAVVNWPWYRQALSRAGGGFVRLATGMPVRDPTSGFRAYRAPFLDTIGIWHTRARGYGFLMEAAFRAWMAGGRIVEVPIVFHERRKGRSKLSRRIILEAFVLALRLGWTSRWPYARRRYAREAESWRSAGRA